MNHSYKLSLEAVAELSLVIQVLYQTGLRIGELITIRLSDCEEKGDKVVIRVLGKGSKERFVRLSLKLFTAIVACCDSQEYLFEEKGKPLCRV